MVFFLGLRSKLSSRLIAEMPLSVTIVVLFFVRSRRDIEHPVSELELDCDYPKISILNKPYQVNRS